MEDCNRCNGKGCLKKEGTFLICESCGGYGTNSWIGNIMGKPEEKSVYEFIHDILCRFIFEINDKKTITMMNSELSQMCEYLKLKFKVEVKSISRDSIMNVRVVELGEVDNEI